MMKRLDRRKKRRLEGCKQKVKQRSSKCICSKCTGFRYVQKKRVIEPDFLANLAYNQRVSRDNETSMNIGDVETVGVYPIKNENKFRVEAGKSKESREDHRDLYLTVYISYLLIIWITFIASKFILEFDCAPAQLNTEIALSAGETWWKNVINQRNMPPLNRNPLDIPTRSEYSSMTSGCRSGTPDIFSDALDVSRSVSPLSTITDEKSYSDDVTHLSQPRDGSKSDSKILPCREDKASEIGPHAAKSASTKTMVLGLSPKEGPSIISTKRKREKKRKQSSCRTTSHASDTFSTCVKCSRILSKAI